MTEDMSQQGVFKLLLENKDNIQKIFKYEIRMKILLLLRLYPKLNVTQVSKLIGRNKATVGRHLKRLKKLGILTSREEDSNRTINPLYYSIRPGINQFFELMNGSEIFPSEDEEQTRQKLKGSLLVVENIYKLVEQAIGLINPFIDHLREKLEERNVDLEQFKPFLTKRRQLSLRHYVLNEEDLDEFWEIYMDFAGKVEELSNRSERDEEKTLLFLDALLPLKKMLKHGGKT